MLDIALAALGVLIIGVVLWDAFETVVLPRRVTRLFRLARAFYRSTWRPWSALGRRMHGTFRETYLGIYGPLSLIMLLIVWAALLILGFAMIQAGIGSVVDRPGSGADFGTDLYMSGSTFFTLGLGDVTPDSTISRIVAVVEAGHGFAFLALVISYLPVLYSAFSRREANVSLLDSRAGSPPSAGEFFLRIGTGRRHETLPEMFEDWERWASDLLESHLSYPVLTYYRSQHEHQSWLAALTALLDVSAIVLCGVLDHANEPAQLTFAMSRHAAVDIAQIFSANVSAQYADRLPPAELARLAEIVGRGSDPEFETKLKELRALYEPYVAALSDYVLMPLPGWLPSDRQDDWQSTAWDN